MGVVEIRIGDDEMKQFTASLLVKKGILGTCLGLVSYVIGSIDLAVIVMFLLIIIDFMTGILGSKASGEKYDKSKAEKGMYKKIAMIIFWLIVVLIEAVIKDKGVEFKNILTIPLPTLAATCYILGTEFLSTINNLGKMGFQVPNWFIIIGNNRKHKERV